MDSRDFLNDEKSPLDIDALFRKRFLQQGCYELVYKTMFDLSGLHEYRWRYIYRIKPECFHRMIRSGYMRKNKSLG
jgi:hypothetical protein